LAEFKVDDFAKSPFCFIFVIPALHPVRDKLQQESGYFRLLWSSAVQE
jgi:hypothetical protein